MRVVLDTNVIVSGILSTTGAAHAIMDWARRGQFDLVTSVILLDEVEEVLERFVSKALASETRAALEELAAVVDARVVPRVSRDPDDDHVIAAAVEGLADYVVTRDGDLISLGTYHDVVFIAPAAFAQVLRAAQRVSQQRPSSARPPPRRRRGRP